MASTLTLETVAEADQFVVDLRSSRGFSEPSNGLRYGFHRPTENRALWTAYLDGAERQYRAHGVESVLDRPAVEDGTTTDHFWTVTDSSGALVGGVRLCRRASSLSDLHALHELVTHPNLDLIAWEMSDRLPDGVAETKTGWISARGDQRGAAAAGLARCIVHSLGVLGVRYILGTAASHAIPLWETAGARAVRAWDPVAYPDDRYRTYVIWWDHDDIETRATPVQRLKLEAETAQLERSGLFEPAAALAGVA